MVSRYCVSKINQYPSLAALLFFPWLCDLLMSNEIPLNHSLSPCPYMFLHPWLRCPIIHTIYAAAGRPPVNDLCVPISTRLWNLPEINIFSKMSQSNSWLHSYEPASHGLQYRDVDPIDLRTFPCQMPILWVFVYNNQSFDSSSWAFHQSSRSFHHCRCSLSFLAGWTISLSSWTKQLHRQHFDK